MQSCFIKRDETGKSAGFGFVNFTDNAGAARAIDDFHGHKWKSNEGTSEEEEKELYVSKHVKKEQRKQDLRKVHEMKRFENQAKYRGVNLYVKNLDDTVDDEALRDAFAQFGTITSAKVMRDEKSASRGFGFVCFGSSEEASGAITSMNGQLFRSKPLYVALAQGKEERRAQLQAQYQQMGARMNGMGMQQQMGPGNPMMYNPNVAQRGGPQMMMFPGQPLGCPGMVRGGMQPHWAGQQGGIMPMQGRGAPYRGSPAARGAPRGGAGQMTDQRNFKFTGAARNQQQLPQQQPSADNAANQSATSDGEMISAQSLAQMSEEEQKNFLGERLFRQIQRVQPEKAGKVTGMLLELDHGELLHMLQTPDALNQKVAEACDALSAAEQ